MSEPFGGYIFIPITPQSSLSEVVQQACQDLSILPDFRIDVSTGQFCHVPLSQNDLVMTVQQETSVDFIAPFSDIRTTFFIRKPDTTSIGVKYYEIRMIAYPDAFQSMCRKILKIRYAPELMDAYAQQWADLCERVGAEFGYLSADLEVWEEIRDAILLEVEQMTMSYFTDSYWLSYWGPRLVALQPAPETAKEDFQMQHMPSGAVMVRSGQDPFVIEHNGVWTRW